jgi:L-lactate dehydrogenase complex protein LldF
MRRDAGREAIPRSFEEAAPTALADRRLRANLAKATTSIRSKRAAVVDELPYWEALRDQGTAVRDRSLNDLDTVLLTLERTVQAAGGLVHWARDALEANETVIRIVAASGAREVVKVKSLTTDEIGLNEALAAVGITSIETDLAELVIQLAAERPSHLLVPALHRSAADIGDLFRSKLGRADLSNEPADLAEAARLHLREAFFRAEVAISGANFAVAETGTVCVVESEGNGRMCTTLPRTLVTVMGIEKAIARWDDLAPLLELLPRSSTGERMNPYTSFWTGVHRGDGPEAFHLVLVDAGRTRALADPVGRDALRCIRCSACVNICPVYRRAGGHAYHTVYAGPIGAILQPQLSGERGPSASLPYASTLCGACVDVCPVRIDIPRLLVHERAKVVRAGRRTVESTALRALARAFSTREGYERAQRLGRSLQRVAVRDGRVTWFPGPLAGWGRSRALPGIPAQTFREWWSGRDGGP